ncbi:MAG TPA: ABC transporter permease [Anaerolineaceae bacterium]|nr:ABC transporter permease [Anaerolineaceae bacterium]
MKRREIPRRFWLAGALLLAFILLPLLSLLFSSSPAALAQTLVDAEVLRSLGVTFAGAGIATALGLLLGLPLAFLLARASFPGKGWVEALVDLPVIIPHTAAGVALLLVFGRQGVLGRWLTPLGLYFTDNLAGIVVAMLFVSLPLLVHPARAALVQLDREVEQSARVDGASGWQVFWQIMLPQAWRGVFSGALMMWARGISEFGAVVILAYHPKVAPVLVFERFNGFGLDAALPVAVILVGVALLVFGSLRWLAREAA